MWHLCVNSASWSCWLSNLTFLWNLGLTLKDSACSHSQSQTCRQALALFTFLCFINIPLFHCKFFVLIVKWKSSEKLCVCICGWSLQQDKVSIVYFCILFLTQSGWCTFNILQWIFNRLCCCWLKKIFSNHTRLQISLQRAVYRKVKDK